jgi:hypothetical protein
MAIVFNCTCGKPLRAKDDSAGKKTKCPHCGAIVAIPGAARVPATVGATSSGQVEAVPIDVVWPTVEAHHPASEPSTGSAQIKIDSLSPAVAPAGTIPGEPQRPSERPRPTDGTLQYKVLSGKDQGMTGQFNPLKLEEVLNDHARQGWAVKAAATIAIASHSGTHEELIVILQR